MLSRHYLDPELYINSSSKGKSILQKDIEGAKERIIISLPSGKIEPKWGDIVVKWLHEAIKKGIEVLVKCNQYKDLPEDWKALTYATENAVFPILMIDEKITWYGVPLADWRFTDGSTVYLTVCPIACRIKGEKTAEMIRSLSDLDFRLLDKVKTKLKPKLKDSPWEEEKTGSLAKFISGIKKCPKCNKSLIMTKGKSGKTILWCAPCKKTVLLSPDDINYYINKEHIKCPKHHCDITAKLGKWGVYIKCDMDHNLKPEEI